MQINPLVPYIPQQELEELANALLREYAHTVEPISAPPVPVEEIADFLLELNIEWLDIDDSDDEPILAFLHPASKTIRLNERRLPYFEEHPGTYQYTLAHEIAHYQLHVKTGDIPPDQLVVYRHKQNSNDRREWQAERFASYLLLPEYLLLPALEQVNPRQWPVLYNLRDQFQVSITALTIRLEELGYLYVGSNGRLYPSQTAAIQGQRQEFHRLVSEGKIHQALGQTTQAQAAYEQALTLAKTLRDRRNTAFLSWQLGLLYLPSDPPHAISLLSACIAYEQEINHPNAQADAEYVAQIKAQLVVE